MAQKVAVAERLRSSMVYPHLALRTPSLVLRLPVDEDAPRLYEAVATSHELLAPWLPWVTPNYAPTDSAEWIAGCRPAWERDQHYSFSLFDPVTGALRGGCGLNFIDRYHEKANLGYWLAADARGRGLATEATRAVARFGLSELGFQRLEIIAALSNVASRRVAERAGAKREGVLRRRIWVRGQLEDGEMYSFIRPDLDGVLRD